MSRRLLRGVALLLPLLVAVAISFAIYRGTRPLDQERHASVLATFQRGRALAAQLKQEVLAARFGLLTHYDPLAATSHEIAGVPARIVEQTTDLGEAQADVVAQTDDLAKRSAAQRERVVAFQASSSILRNSLYYLPVAGEALLARLTSDDGKIDRAARDDVRALVESTLVLNLVGGDEARSRFATRASAMRARVAALPEEVRGDAKLFLLHAETVDREGRKLDVAIQEILGDDVEVGLSHVETAYRGAVVAAERRGARWRTGLYAWSALLTIGITVAVLKLVGLYGKLEQRVAERTAELNRALEALWGEMALAKKIQLALVPAAPELAGCDLAALMKPADEVGGDYYDVVHVGDAEWILIGDVSGHGVPAGLVMMMCQTAVRTALVQDPTMSPAELLAVVNRTLTANIRRLGENKYMTLQAIRRDGPGSFTYAGLHQDLLIYRAADQRVETLRPQGMWIGIVDDIAGKLTSDSFELGIGDVLLLFTDGVTEATRDGAMLDVSGLAALLQELGGADASAIRDGISARLGDFECHDDVSVVVVRNGQPAAA